MGRMEMGRRRHLCCEWRVHGSVSWSEARDEVLRCSEGVRGDSRQDGGSKA